MKYVILIHSNPQPWGHPTGDYLEAAKARTAEEKASSDAAFDALMTELSERGELVSAEALGDPTSSRLYTWGTDNDPVVTDGPYSEAREHLAGFFLIDVESPERAEQVALHFGVPGEVIELRPTMWPGGDEG